MSEFSFNQNSKNIEKVYSDNGEAWEVSIYFDRSNGHYYLKGPFGRWDAVTTRDLGTLTDEQLSKWIETHEKVNSIKPGTSTYFPRMKNK